ncbi:MAG: DUF502 domain-containing protein [Helicobacteraceae bacterium]|nr:DUF502 domain-containing protein [Helicobacteraceae bacterium]
MKSLIRYLFVGTLALMPISFVVILVLWLKELGVSAFLSIYDVTDSTLISTLLIVSVSSVLMILGYTIEVKGKSLFISLIDKVVEKIPAIRTIYSITKKVAELFSGKDSDFKKEVVLVEYPKDDLWSPAYIVNKHKDVVVLFVPTSPNPTNGYTVITQEKNILHTSLTLEEASSFIISMGSDLSKKEELYDKLELYYSKRK